ncbi:hypothetical protein [Micromonospora sp. WMMD710]|uniref:DUF6414 family protein n=1 Tax=Micromonospora sp. WMMD710 TaxID=3016085 RepID=UPI002417DE2E|nr:hypothetical protein [Micromonospora sp. WMMD710]MDG4760741.1 hypothetical protein [Micromonospora sp. WMMD710]
MLRELIYVDSDKVRSLLSQREGGIAEDQRVTEKKQGTLSGGVRHIASREQIWGTEESTQRSLADAVFPMLEEALTAEGYLSDISDELQNTTSEIFDSFKEKYPPGSFVRITAPSRLFDARYVANAFAGYATAADGVTDIDSNAYAVQPAGARTPAPRNKPGTKRAAKDRVVSEFNTLESLIPEFDYSQVGGIPASQLRAFVKVARGVFHPGFHLAMAPGGSEGVSVTARLQEDRRFLDSEPEILFSRYGVQEQEWTLVGTIGAYSPPPDYTFDSNLISRTDGTGVDRGKLAQLINNLLTLLGALGLADQPQHPGFSVVPFAVYRLILPTGGVQEHPATSVMHP